MSTMKESVDVDVPVTTAYNQWTQFESFPQFMDGVEEIRQISDTTTHWKTKIAGVEREFDAQITEQVPDRKIAWASADMAHAGEVTFEPVDAGKTRVTAKMAFKPEGFVETAGDKLGLVEHRMSGDLKRFKEFVEQRGTATGAWRGEV
ncbi:SRPBCC family protein [Pilimelia columellifera]|uniref:SRPBCC family protein n=1 Tax=Pilimelia columellifera subsp. columellifera TaxID=706583 RepID=A0ABN3NGI0_9ACTN